jgi:hypothetical protein
MGRISEAAFDRELFTDSWRETAKLRGIHPWPGWLDPAFDAIEDLVTAEAVLIGILDTMRIGGLSSGAATVEAMRTYLLLGFVTGREYEARSLDRFNEQIKEDTGE